MKSRKTAVLGRVAQVDICPDEGGFILSVGRVSLWLAIEDALDVAETLTRALDQEMAAASAKSESEGESEGESERESEREGEAETPPALGPPFRGPPKA